MTVAALMSEAIGAARQVKGPDWKALALSKVASVVGERDKESALSLLDEALRLTRQVPDPSWRLSVLMTVLTAFSPFAIDQAKEMVKGLPSLTMQVMALVDMAERARKKNPSQAIALLQDAERLAHAISDPQSQQEALSAVAEGWGEVDPEKAVTLSAQIRDPALRVSALAVAIRRFATMDPPFARELGEQGIKLAEQIKDIGERTKALDELVDALAPLDVERALSLVWVFPFPDRKAIALSVIAETLAGKVPRRAEGLLKDALQIARKVKDPDRYASALRGIVTVMAKLDIHEALRLAQSLRDPDWRDWTLGDLAASVAPSDPQKAEEIALQIRDEEERASAFADIVIALALRDFPKAVSLARQIPDAFYRAQALAELMAFLIRGGKGS